MVNLGGLNINKMHIKARFQCARCGHIFKENEFKIKLTDDDGYICEECTDKIKYD